MKHALVTGAAGFIGSHLVDRLLSEGWRVTGIDNFDPFYPREIKEKNISRHRIHPKYELIEIDIRHFDEMQRRISGDFDVVIHLAAKAGVRPSIDDPLTYQEVNVQGTQNLLELTKIWRTKQFIFASSSSVYGINPNIPWRESDHVLMPISPYASTKVSGELLGHVYSHLYGINFVGLRFFTVYGPRQRPDLAISKFFRLMLEDKPIDIYGDGSTYRDYTYIDDIIDGIMKSTNLNSNYEIINLGNNTPLSLSSLLLKMSKWSGVVPNINFQPEQAGDVPKTMADTEKMSRILGLTPKIDIDTGLQEYLLWLHGK